MRNALIALGDCGGDPGDLDGGITLVGEKNLEDDVEENFREVSRLLALLGVRPGLRFVRGLKGADMRGISRGRLNILREPELSPVGESLAARFGTPYIGSFPVGCTGSLRFLGEVAGRLGLDPTGAIDKERAFQEEALLGFDDLRGERISLSPPARSAASEFFTADLAASLDLRLGEGGVTLPFPSPLPVGTGGLVRLLHRWRRVLHA